MIIQFLVKEVFPPLFMGSLVGLTVLGMFKGIELSAKKRLSPEQFESAYSKDTRVWFFGL